MFKHKELSIPLNTEGCEASTLKAIVDGIRKLDERRVQELKDRIFNEKAS